MKQYSAFCISGRLEVIEASLRKPLCEVLAEFHPDKQFTEHLAPVIREFGDRSLHEFMVHWITNEDANKVDILNGEMRPFNIFLVLHPMYR